MRETATQNKSVLRDGADRVRKLAAATTTGILQNRKRYVNDQLTRAAYTSAVEPSVIKALQKESAVTNSRAGKYKKAYKSVYLAGQGSIPSPIAEVSQMNESLTKLQSQVDAVAKRACSRKQVARKRR